MRKLVFLVGNQTGFYGSAFLRARQIRDLLSVPMYKFNVQTHLMSDPSLIAESIVIVNKTAIIDNEVALISRLKELKNYVLVDPVDLNIASDYLSNADTIITASRTQTEYLRTKLPVTRICYVPHHVDLRITHVDSQKKAFNCAYFGDILNGLFINELQKAELLDVVSASDVSSTKWMCRLENYNAHYVVRNNRRIDGFKPFTKGFIAACCGAVVIVGSGDHEASQYLGSSYPYSFRIENIAQAVNCLRAVKESFMSPEWYLARDVLEEIRYGISTERVIASFVEAISPWL